MRLRVPIEVPALTLKKTPLYNASARPTHREARLRCSITIVVFAAWLAFSTGSRAQELVNLGKLGDTFADASSVNAGRTLDNVFYGVPNLFDGGHHIVNNINYTYWLSDSATRHWIKLGLPPGVRQIV